MPYTKEHEEAEKKIYSALEKEYRRLIDSGKTDIQALGEIMYKYGDIGKAAALAGIDRQEPLSRQD